MNKLVFLTILIKKETLKKLFITFITFYLISSQQEEKSKKYLTCHKFSADRWKQERKLLNSSFSLPILQSFIPIFNKCIANSIEHLNEKCDKGEFDIRSDVTLVVMNAVMSECIKTLQHFYLTSPFYFNRHDFRKGHISRCCTSIHDKYREVCATLLDLVNI